MIIEMIIRQYLSFGYEYLSFGYLSFKFWVRYLSFGCERILVLGTNVNNITR